MHHHTGVFPEHCFIMLDLAIEGDCSTSYISNIHHLEQRLQASLTICEVIVANENVVGLDFSQTAVTTGTQTSVFINGNETGTISLSQVSRWLRIAGVIRIIHDNDLDRGIALA